MLSDVELFTQQLNEGVAAQSTGKKDKKKSKKKSKNEKGEQNIVPAFTNPMSGRVAEWGLEHD